MRNLIKPLSLLIGVYIVIVSLFSFAYDTSDIKNESSELEQNSYVTAMLDEADTLGPVDTTNVVIDNIYTELVLNKFIEDAEKNGLNKEDVIKHIKALDAIIVDDLNQYDLLGVTVYRKEILSPTGIRGIIIINQDLLMNPDLYMLTLYHELGHWFGLDHCGCTDSIMMDKYDNESVNKIYEEWNKAVKSHMKKIGKRYDRRNKSYDFPDLPKNKLENIHKFGENIVCEHAH